MSNRFNTKGVLDAWMTLKFSKNKAQVTMPTWQYATLLVAGTALAGFTIYTLYQQNKAKGYSPYVNENIDPALLHVNQGQAYSPQATPYTVNAPNIYNSPMTRRNPIANQTIHRTPSKFINPPRLGFNPGQVNYYSPLALPFEEGHPDVYYSPFSYTTRWGAGNPKTTGGPEWLGGGEKEFGLRGRCPGGCRG